MKYFVALVVGIIAWVVIGTILASMINGCVAIVVGLLAGAFAFGGYLGWDDVRSDRAR